MSGPSNLGQALGPERGGREESDFNFLQRRESERHKGSVRMRREGDG